MLVVVFPIVPCYDAEAVLHVMNNVPLLCKEPLPLWLKVAYTLLMAILLPIYLKRYGQTNFLCFCDVGAIVTLVVIWIIGAWMLLSICYVYMPPNINYVYGLTGEERS